MLRTRTARRAMRSAAIAALALASCVLTLPSVSGYWRVWMLVGIFAAAADITYSLVKAYRSEITFRRVRRALDRELAPRVHVQTSNPFRTEV